MTIELTYHVGSPLMGWFFTNAENFNFSTVEITCFKLFTIDMPWTGTGTERT